MKKLNLGLCRGRHAIAEVEGYVFESEITPSLITEPEELEWLAQNRLKDLCWELLDEKFSGGMGVQLNLYATGLTVALLATINAARRCGVMVIVYHYDRATGEYYPQSIY